MAEKTYPCILKRHNLIISSEKSPKANKEIIRAEKTIKFDEYIDNKGLSANIKYLYQDIDIYDNEIFFLSNKFLSPVSATAPIMYRYYIIDTSLVDERKMHQIVL